MLTLFLYTHDKKEYNLTNMLVDATWSGDINTLPRTLEVSLKNVTDKDDERRAVNFDVGNMVLLKHDDQEIFRGYIFKRSINSDGNENFTAYDELIYAVKNSHSTIIKNKTASVAITELMKKFGIQIGSIESTNIKISKLVFQAKNLSDIFLECLKYDKSRSNKSYHIFSSKGKAYVWSRAKAAKSTISINDVISSTQDVSIEDLKTKVIVAKGNFDPKAEDAKSKDFVPYTEVSVVDEAATKKYGTLQMIEDADDKSSLSAMKNIGNTLLAQNNKPEITSSIEFIGNITCITGKRIEIKDELTGLVGIFYITSDNHSFSNGNHKMSLQLSKKLE